MNFYLFATILHIVIEYNKDKFSQNIIDYDC